VTDEQRKKINQEINNHADWKGDVVGYDYFSTEGPEIFLKIEYRFGDADYSYSFPINDSMFTTIAAELKKRGHAS
jgi:hypothetical protein